MSTEYSTIRLPKEFCDQFIVPFVNAKYGFTSNADVVKAAMREFAGKHEKKDVKEVPQ